MSDGRRVPRADDGDGRGLDTMNRLLLHAARHHDREAVFLRWDRGRDGWGWQPTPDWRADRRTIRVALVLRQRLGVAEGDAVALWRSPDPESAVLERAVWSIGAVSVPLSPEWPAERVEAVLADARPCVLFAGAGSSVPALEVIGGIPDSVAVRVHMEGAGTGTDDHPTWADVLEHGGVLDTPERASMWRGLAGSFRPDTVATCDYGDDGAGPRRELDHAALVGAAQGLLRAFPASSRRTWLVASGHPGLLARLVLHAGWADGRTTTAFVGAPAARAAAAGLGPELVVGPREALRELLTAAGSGSGRGDGAGERRFLSLGLGGGGRGRRDAPARGRGPGASRGSPGTLYAIHTPGGDEEGAPVALAGRTADGRPVRLVRGADLEEAIGLRGTRGDALSTDGGTRDGGRPVSVAGAPDDRMIG